MKRIAIGIANAATLCAVVVVLLAIVLMATTLTAWERIHKPTLTPS